MLGKFVELQLLYATFLPTFREIHATGSLTH